MQQNFDASLSHVLESEGGYSNDPVDHGGETNFGVTKVSWAEYLGRTVQPGEMRKLSKAVITPYYRTQYWDKCRCDELPAGLDYAVFDFAVNAGPGRAAKFLQRAVGAVDDGVLGPATMAAVAKTDPKAALDHFSLAKWNFYKGLVERDPTQKRFINGWLNRVGSVEKIATTMLA